MNSFLRLVNGGGGLISHENLCVNELKKNDDFIYLFLSLDLI